MNKFDSLPLSSLASYLEAPDSPRRAPPAAGPPMSSHAAPRRADVSQPTSLVHRLQQQRDSPKKRVPFTEEEDARLKEYVEDRVRAGARAFGNKIYQEFEEEVRISRDLYCFFLLTIFRIRAIPGSLGSTVTSFSSADHRPIRMLLENTLSQPHGEKIGSLVISIQDRHRPVWQAQARLRR